MAIKLKANGHQNLPVDNMDPAYKRFLEHLRIDGKSYILDMEDGDDGSPLFVKYEQFDACISSGNYGFDRKENFRTKKGRIYKKSKGQSGEIVKNSSFLLSQVQNALVVDSKEEMPFDSTCPFKNKAGSNLEDDSYKEFLSCLKVQDGLMVMKYNSITVIYEEDKMPAATETSPPASQMHDDEATTYSDKQELVLYEGALHPDVVIYEGDDMAVAPFDPSPFDLKLMDVLSKPYDESEHEELWKQANFRKPVLRHKDLRNQSKSFYTKQMGFSYLDHFPDLARKLEHSDPLQSLTLLRGLFFWLKNLCHDGAHQPWLSAGSKIVEVSDHDMILSIKEERMET